MVDIIKNIHNDLEGRVPDAVAFPAKEAQIGALLSCCERNNWACIVWGGGSSVVQGVEPPPASAGFKATLTIDMRMMSRVLEVDQVSMCVRVEAGLYGPDLEKELKRSGLSLRYFPQSFEFSTVGGWLATRGGGHFATGPTHIDEMVQSLRVVSPAGITETPRLPASGAGPAEHRHYIGSEGIYGVITSCWLRVLPRPRYRASAVCIYPAMSSPEESFLCGTRALRAVVQSGFRPANLRLVDGAEMLRMTGEAGAKEGCATCLLGLESASWENLDPEMERLVTLVQEGGGVLDGPRPLRWTQDSDRGKREGIAGSWGSGFMSGGYLLSTGCVSGILINTFETAVGWDKWEAFHQEVTTTLRATIDEQCPGGGGEVTCRITHVYPDGLAPYYTILAPGDVEEGEGDRRIEQWAAIKAAATRVMIKHGTTATHHHAVGKLHRPHYEMERGALFEATVRAIKTTHDPQGILNPDVLIRTSKAGEAASSFLGGMELKRPTSRL